MKKLWKDNGGYALVYVLIVVLVLCAVAVSVCTAALKNYQAQERSIRQTRQLYQAEGEIEKFVALAEDVSSLQESAEYESEDDAKAEAKGKYLAHLSAVKEKVGNCTFTPPDSAETGSECCTFALTYANDAVRIETKLKMELKYKVKKIEKQEPQPNGTFKEVIKYTAKVSKAAHSYSTYTITHLTAEGGASG